MRLPVLLVAALALAGCLAPPAQVQPAGLAASGLGGLLAGDAVRIDAEQPAREPAIVETTDGALYVAGFWGFGRATEHRGSTTNLLQGPLVWTSADAGATWRRIDPGFPYQGAIGNSDLDLATDGQGSVYLASLSYYSPPTLPVAPPPEADVASTLSVVVGATHDAGETWRWTLLDAGSSRSHPWVAAAPDGRIHVVWGDGLGIRHVVSQDRGFSWEDAGRVHDAGEAGGLVVAPGGALAVRVTPLGSPNPADGVAVSEDGGATWALRELPGDRTGEPQGFGSVAFDASGALWAAWSEGQALVLARSRDLGATWDLVPIVEEPEGSVPYFPYLRGGPAGQVGAAWFTRTGDVVAARAALVTDQAEGSPRALTGTLAEDTGGTNHADYYQLALLRDGGLAAAVPMTEGLGQWFDYRVARAG